MNDHTCSENLFEIPKIPTVSTAFGPVMACTYVSLILYGLFLQQVYKYFTVYDGDAKWIKSLVAAAMIEETVATVLHAHLMYYYMVLNFGNILVFTRGVWSLDLIPVFSSGIMISCQAFYTVRIWRVGPSRYRLILVAIIILLMAAAFGVSTVSTVAGFRGITIFNFQNLIGLVLVYNSVASAGDIILTSTLIYILHNSRTGFRSTDSMINRLITYTISTGLLTTIFNILSLILVHLYGIQNFVWLGTMMIAERLYANALMTALNSRKISASKQERREVPSDPQELFGRAEHLDRRRLSQTQSIALELPQVNPQLTDPESVIHIKPLAL